MSEKLSYYCLADLKEVLIKILDGEVVNSVVIREQPLDGKWERHPQTELDRKGVVVLVPTSLDPEFPGVSPGRHVVALLRLFAFSVSQALSGGRQVSRGSSQVTAPQLSLPRERLSFPLVLVPSLDPVSLGRLGSRALDQSHPSQEWGGDCHPCGNHVG